MTRLLATFKKIRINRSWLVLAVALSLGVVVASGTRAFLDVRVKEIEARGQGETVEVVVAKEALDKGAPLSAATVAVRRVPAPFAHSGSVRPEEFARIDGRTTSAALAAGDPIMWSQVDAPRQATFSAQVPAGQRAITVPVDEVNSISGMLMPGDAIDLMYSAEHDGRRSVRRLLAKVTVLATGRQAREQLAGAPDSAPASFTTVTLAATPEQARSIILARDSGKLTALLRNPADQHAGAPEWHLPGVSEAPAGTRLRRARVPILYGASPRAPSAPPPALLPQP